MRAGQKRVAISAVIVLCCGAIAFALTRSNDGPYLFPNAAMKPTIKSGETVQADISAYETADPQRWELVVFRSPVMEDRTWIFRVIGMPGETISFDEDGLLIDGKPAELPDHLRDVSYSAPAGELNGVDHPFKVPESSYYVLGDNPAKASDSRHWGAVGREAILGKVTDR